MGQIILFQTQAFSRQLEELNSPSHFTKLAGRLREHPNLGDVIPGTGGLRKIRLALADKGSRGGARIIYIWLKEAEEIFFLWVYAKGQAEDLTREEKTALAAVAAKIKTQRQNAKEKNGG